MSADFDKAIDRAVRQMLDAEPPAGLRARVMERLSASSSRLPASGSRLPAPSSQLPAASFRLPAFGFRFAVASAVAAVLVVAIVLTWRVEEPAERPRLARVGDATLPADGSPQRPSGPAVVSTAPPHNTAERSRALPGPARVVTATVFAPASDTIGIEPLEAITPIHVAALADHRVTAAAISVQPLNPITDLQIAPLNPPDRRN